MRIPFTKYHGTGNDFVIIDDREENFDVHNVELIHSMCDRRFGIGADGLILLRNIEKYDFQMVYFNSDGNQSSMCGNGGRCIVQFAHSLGLFEKDCSFLAIDGEHEALVLESKHIRLKMGDVNTISSDGNALVLNTGSPHYVIQVENVADVNVKTKGALIRYSEQYAEEGINVNFLECRPNGIVVATYERGVEDETFSCGTGVTASALAIHKLRAKEYQSPISIATKGGNLKVYFKKLDEQNYSDIWLEGPATKTFEGVYPH
ncbi:MAG: diaminopimelate epimerase, partial [Bacteroidota bacterium]